MDIVKLISALDSDLKRVLLKLLAEQPLTVSEAQTKLKNRGIEVRYRETVYRALETLVNSEIVEKYYEKEKGLTYKLIHHYFIIKISKASLDVNLQE